ncbi:MAG: hypothetical protein N2689_13365 [Verrucomicrobiae bacterium]|nr:hypothetical protein [Verrucomicrobiae bacterium]
MDAAGRLVEDWGTLAVQLAGDDLPAAGATKVEAVKLDDVIPAARAVSQRGPVTLTTTAYRSPVWPAGLDVLVVRVEETAGQPKTVTVSIELPPKAQRGAQTVGLGRQTILTLPSGPLIGEKLRDWGYCDTAASLPRWAKPVGPCDPAFRNIRAGMGGVPIVYRFKVAPKSAAHVVLGLCESHWDVAGKRPLVCSVEGAPPQQVDPVTRWGRHKPGALSFAARDANGDGWLEITVTTPPSVPDRNPILNAIWLFPSGPPPALDQVIAGNLNAKATRVVDCGGDNDQSIYPPGKLEYQLALPARGAQELTFLVACGKASLPPFDQTAWTADTLRRAAREVWRDWRE